MIPVRKSHFCTVWHYVSKLFKHSSYFEIMISISSLQVDFQVASLTLMLAKTLAVSRA